MKRAEQHREMRQVIHALRAGIESLAQPPVARSHMIAIQRNGPVPRTQGHEHPDNQHGHHPQQHPRNQGRARLSRPESNRRFRLLRYRGHLHQAKYSRQETQVEPKAAQPKAAQHRAARERAQIKDFRQSICEGVFAFSSHVPSPPLGRKAAPFWVHPGCIGQGFAPLSHSPPSTQLWPLQQSFCRISNVLGHSPCRSATSAVAS